MVELNGFGSSLPYMEPSVEIFSPTFKAKNNALYGTGSSWT